MAKAVVNGQGCDVDDGELESGPFAFLEKRSDDIVLDGDENDIDFAGGGFPDNVMVPLDILEGKGDLLLGFVPNDLIDLGLFDCRKLDKPGEDGLAGN